MSCAVEQSKVCSGKCKRRLPLSSFTRNRARSDGLSHLCRECDRERWQSWYVRNRERHQENRRRFEARNPEYVAEKLRRRQERIASAPGGVFDPKRSEYQARVALYGGRCAYCRKRPAAVLDHAIPVARGGSNWPANIYPACVPCNSSKGARTLLEWRRRQ